MLSPNDPLLKSTHIPDGYHNSVTTRGENIIINGEFDTDTDWDKTGDAIISGGVATFVDNSIGRTGTWSPTVALDIEVGKMYLIQVDATLISATLDITIGGQSIPQLSSSGEFNFVISATTTDDLVITGEIVSGKTRDFSFDNVIVSEIGYIEGSFSLLSATLIGNMSIEVDNVIDIGSDGKGLKRLFLGTPSLGSSLPNFNGLVFFYTNGDAYIGNDNVFPGYYVQKTVVHNSVASDNSEDYTNLYQGDANYPRLAFMYAIENDGDKAVEIGGGASSPVPLSFGGNLAFYFQLDTVNNKFIIDGNNSNTPILEIGLNSLTVQEAIRPKTDNKIDLGDDANNLIWRQIHAYIIDLATEIRVAGTKVVGSQGGAITDAVTSHDCDATYNETQLEGFLDSLGSKINEIISTLETHGLIST